MQQEARISSRIDADLKAKGDAILAELGMKPSQAITMFYTQIVRQRELPFDLKIPNDDLIEAMQEVKDPEYLAKAKRYRSAAEFLNELDEA